MCIVSNFIQQFNFSSNLIDEIQMKFFLSLKDVSKLLYVHLILFNLRG